MQPLDVQDARRVIESLPRDIVDLMKDRRITLAGGFIRAKIAGDEVQDIDLFSENEDAARSDGAQLAVTRGVEPRRTKNGL